MLLNTRLRNISGSWDPYSKSSSNLTKCFSSSTNCLYNQIWFIKKLSNLSNNSRSTAPQASRLFLWSVLTSSEVGRTFSPNKLSKTPLYILDLTRQFNSASPGLEILYNSKVHLHQMSLLKAAILSADRLHNRVSIWNLFWARKSSCVNARGIPPVA